MDCCDLKSNSLLNWSDPRFTGLIFGSINIAFILHWSAEMNLFTILAYLLIFYISVGIVIAKIMTKEEPERGDNYEHVSKEKVENWVKGLYRIAIELDQYIRRVVSLEDHYLTLKFFAAVFTVNTVSYWFCESFLIWLGINFYFIWTPVYNSYKELIDGTMETSKRSLLEYYEIVKTMIPKYEERK